MSESITKNDSNWKENSNKLTFTTPLPSKIFIEAINVENRILDLGCGYGRVLSYLENNGFRNLVGVDISEELLMSAKKVCQYSNLKVGSFESIPCRDNEVDIIFLMAVISNCITKVQERKMINEINRVLKPKGIIFLEFFMLDLRPKKLKMYLAGLIRHGEIGRFKTSQGFLFKHRSINQVRRLFSDYSILEIEEIMFTTWSGANHKGCKMILEKTVK